MVDVNLSPTSDLNATIEANIVKWRDQQEAAPQEEGEEVVSIIGNQEKSEQPPQEKKPEAKEEPEEEQEEEAAEQPEQEEPEAEEPKEEQAAEVVATIKVDGREVNLTEEQLLKYAQRGYASDDRFQRAAQAMKEADEKVQSAAIIYKAVQQDPLGTLIQLHGEGPVRQLIEQWLMKKVQFEMMDPNEQKKITSQQEAQYWEQQAQMKKQQVEQTVHNEQVAAYERSINEQTTHMLKTKKLPDNKVMRKRIYTDIGLQLDAGADEPSVEEAVDRVWNEIINEHSQIVDTLPNDELKSRFGKTAEKLRKASVSDFKAKQKGPTARRTTKQKNSTPKTISDAERRKKAGEDYLKQRIDLPIFYEE